jgi:hypothetical protein
MKTGKKDFLKRDCRYDHIFRGDHPDTRTNEEWVKYMRDVKLVKSVTY